MDTCTNKIITMELGTESIAMHNEKYAKENLFGIVCSESKIELRWRFGQTKTDGGKEKESRTSSYKKRNSEERAREREKKQL